MFEVRKNISYSVHDTKEYRSVSEGLSEMEANRMAMELNKQAAFYKDKLDHEIAIREEELERLRANTISS